MNFLNYFALFWWIFLVRIHLIRCSKFLETIKDANRERTAYEKDLHAVLESLSKIINVKEEKILVPSKSTSSVKSSRRNIKENVKSKTRVLKEVADILQNEHFVKNEPISAAIASAKQEIPLTECKISQIAKEFQNYVHSEYENSKNADWVESLVAKYISENNPDVQKLTNDERTSRSKQMNKQDRESLLIKNQRGFTDLYKRQMIKICEMYLATHLGAKQEGGETKHHHDDVVWENDPQWGLLPREMCTLHLAGNKVLTVYTAWWKDPQTEGHENYWIFLRGNESGFVPVEVIDIITGEKQKFNGRVKNILSLLNKSSQASNRMSASSSRPK